MEGYPQVQWVGHNIYFLKLALNILHNGDHNHNHPEHDRYDIMII